MKSADNIQRKKKDDFLRFYTRLQSFIPELTSYVSGSLKSAESQALLDRGFYDTDELVDEICLGVFEEASSETDSLDLQHALFKLAIEKIEAKKQQEIPDEVNTHALLKAELKGLNEEFTTDGDGDRILFEELDDISYRQKQGWSKEIYLDESLEQQLIAKLELHEASLLSAEKRGLLGHLYSTIPNRSKTVIELFVFGDRSVGQISEILDVPEDIVNNILFRVKERFRLL